MKATGIVYRIEERVIITQRRDKPLYLLGIWAVFGEKLLMQKADFDEYIAKAREIPSLLSCITIHTDRVLSIAELR